MKILHSADWHFGKTLDGYSRLEEQEQFVEDFVELSKKEKPHIILISGDIFDNPNPPAIAQSIFYNCIKEASNNGDTLVLVIPGNHDNALRLAAAKYLAIESGIIILEDYNEIIQTGKYGNNEILSSSEGVITVKIREEMATIAMVPFLSEVALGSNIFSIENNEEENAKKYQDKLQEIFENRAKSFSNESVNIIMAHLFTVKSELEGDERATTLGASYIIDSKIFPKTADYIALGHIHKYQEVQGTDKKAYYSGSPIHYNKTEIKTEQKCVIMAEFDDNKKATITKIPVPVYKKIEIWKTNSLEETITLSEEKKDENSFVYIEINTKEIITSKDIADIKKNKKDIIDIKINVNLEDRIFETQNIEEKSEKEKFEVFYQEQMGQLPDEKITSKFLKYLSQIEMGEE